MLANAADGRLAEQRLPDTRKRRCSGHRIERGRQGPRDSASSSPIAAIITARTVRRASSSPASSISRRARGPASALHLGVVHVERQLSVCVHTG